MTGLLLVGVVAELDGVFAAAGSLLSRAPGGPVVTYLAALALVAVVTAVLNLDTAVFFLTPILLHLARHRGVDESPYLYGSVFMSNASSLYLPGSNLTNLIVLHGERVSGAQFLARMWAPATTATGLTALGLAAAFHSELRVPAKPRAGTAPWRRGIGVLAVAAATACILLLGSPALPVLVIGLLAVAAARVRPAHVLHVVDVRVLAALFVLAVLVGGLGRAWHGPASLLHETSSWETAGIGAAAALCLNNLPASMLLTAEPVAHARSLLLGLNLGPNLAITGSLSAFLWLRVARVAGARPSIGRYSLLGLAIAPLSLAASLAALWLAAPGRL